MKKNQESFSRLVDLVALLRKKCPWDREQTMESLRMLTLEETYELGEAILKGNPDETKEELGDLLMHIVFYAKIASEKKHFELCEVINSICEKLIRRHPHVFDKLKLKDSDAVKTNWEKIKLSEKKRKDYSVLAGVPASLPALIKSQRLQAKAKAVGFDWERKEDVWQKVQEELSELKHELETGSCETQTKEFGDVFFSLINLARFYKINGENALEKTNLEFIRRFRHIEKMALQKGTSIDKLSLNEMEKYWNEAKSQ